MLTAAGQRGRDTVLTGTVVGLDGEPITSAVVTLRETTGAAMVEKTNESGIFRLQTERQLRYELSVETTDHRRGELVVLHPEIAIRIVVRSARAGTAMEFADKPEFTVAGVTDWTAVGGHGSDATLRTSEDMARQMAMLNHSENTSLSGGEASREPEEAHLRADVTAKPESYAANSALGHFYLRAGRFADASSFLEKASNLHERSSFDEFAAALACQGEGDFVRARRHVERALTQADAADSHRLLGELDEQLGDPLGATHEEQRAVALDPTEENYFVWGSELLLHRAILQAAEVFSRGSALHPGSRRLKTGWGSALFAEARYDQAAQLLCQASDLEPTNRETYIFLGKMVLGSPSIDTCATEKLDRFVRDHPNDAEANYYEAMVLLKAHASGDLHRAEELLHKAVALKAGFAEGYLQLGILASTRQDHAEAQRDFEQAIAADPLQAEAHYRLGVIYDRTGRSEQARTEFRRHEMLVNQQAEAVERERQQVKQFLVVLGSTTPRQTQP